jgi:hypothetical protein
MFTDRKGRQIGEVEPTGVADAVDDDVTPTHEIQDAIPEEVDELDPPENQEELEESPGDLLPRPKCVRLENPGELENPGDLQPHPNCVRNDEIQEAMDIETVVDQEPIVIETVVDEADEMTPPLVATPGTQETPEAIPGVRRSTRTRKHNKSYVPSMKGKRYEVSAVQTTLHPDAHMSFCLDMMREQPDVVEVIMTQLSLKSGLKRWGKKGRKAAKSEMKQLHMRETFVPKHWRNLSELERATILESHMFLKEKRTGEIKGRTVAGGNKQRDFISKEDASSPTVATEAVLLTCIVDAEEERDIAVVDIPNAFIQTKIKNKKDMAIIKIRGVLVDFLLEIAPEFYGPYITKDKKGIKQLIVQCTNAIYGTMVASLLYYRKFCETLKVKGLK